MKIGGGFTVVVSAVLVFVAVFRESASTLYLLTRGIAWVVGSALGLCFFFVPWTVCHGISSSMHVSSTSSSLAVVDREVREVDGCCGAGAFG